MDVDLEKPLARATMRDNARARLQHGIVLIVVLPAIQPALARQVRARLGARSVEERNEVGSTSQASADETLHAALPIQANPEDPLLHEVRADLLPLLVEPPVRCRAALCQPWSPIHVGGYRPRPEGRQGVRHPDATHNPVGEVATCLHGFHARTRTVMHHDLRHGGEGAAGVVKYAAGSPQIRH
eukprot:12899043-Heterocapsa_arctica.AAC.2